MIMLFIKQSITATPERKKRWSFRIWSVVSSLFPFIGLIIATNQSWYIKTSAHPDPTDNFYAGQLKIVGVVPPGLNIIRVPKFRQEFGDFFAACIPLALGINQPILLLLSATKTLGRYYHQSFDNFYD